MAQFTNQASLSYNGLRVLSNIAVGSVQEVLTVTKTALIDTYAPESVLTYVVSLVNTGSTALTGLTITDDLGGYTFGTETVYPLSYVEDSAKLYLEGVLIPTPPQPKTAPLTFSGVDLPAESELVIVYQATVTEYAPFGTDAEIVNTVTVTGDIASPVSATETVTPSGAPMLSITKSVSPVPVTNNGELTYTFVIENYGAEAAAADANVTVSDTFNPILYGLSVTLDGITRSPTTDYTYDDTTGEFETTPGLITVPGATYAQDPDTGVYVTTPGTVTLTVSGTI